MKKKYIWNQIKISLHVGTYRLRDFESLLRRARKIFHSGVPFKEIHLYFNKIR